MKKLVSVILAALLAVSVVACSSADEKTAELFGVNITGWVDFTDDGYIFKTGTPILGRLQTDWDDENLSSSTLTKSYTSARNELQAFFDGLETGDTVPFDISQVEDEVYRYYYGMINDGESVSLMEPFFMLFYNDFTMAVMVHADALAQDVYHGEGWQYADVAYPVNNPDYARALFIKENFYLPENMEMCGYDMTRWYVDGGRMFSDVAVCTTVNVSSGGTAVKTVNNQFVKPFLDMMRLVDFGEKNTTDLIGQGKEVYTVFIKDPGIVSGDWVLIPAVRFTFSADFTSVAVTDYTPDLQRPQKQLSDVYTINNPDTVKAYFESVGRI